MSKLIKIPLYVGILFIVGMIAGHLTFKFLSLSTTVEVPDLKGKSVAEAVNILQSKGLHLLGAAEDYDTEITPGFIVRQDIPPLTKVKEGRGIKVIVSKGPRIQYVPDVIGMKLEEAEPVLAARGIRIAKAIYVHTDIEKNIIIAHIPESDEKGGDNFRVIVSLGSFEEGKK
jgi:beta-lactam-binding protein with PASTA domain